MATMRGLVTDLDYSVTENYPDTFETKSRLTLVFTIIHVAFNGFVQAEAWILEPCINYGLECKVYLFMYWGFADDG